MIGPLLTVKETGLLWCCCLGSYFLSDCHFLCWRISGEASSTTVILEGRSYGEKNVILLVYYDNTWRLSYVLVLFLVLVQGTQ
jgi:hypothetical protein